MEHTKTYSSVTEESFRFKIFTDRLQTVTKHNQRYELGLESFELGINQFSDMLTNEINQQMNGLNHTLIQSTFKNSQLVYMPESIEVDEEINWNEKGAVTPVKNQGNCGSCWAFASTGCLEGQTFLKTGKLVSLSEQNLVDCSGSHGNHGCSGGWMMYAYKYIADNKGIDTEDSYPYEAVQEKCHFNPKTVGATDTGSYSLVGNEKTLMKFVGTVGPISVAIDAGQNSFHLYSKGVYYEPLCGKEVNHAVLVVGYGTDSYGQDYWLVKNSWGEQWGDGGYIKMARNKNNNCEIASYAIYPKLI